MADLFQQNAEDYFRRHAPLAERMRPHGLDDLIGQEELVGPGRPLRQMLESGTLKSLVLWGPPGTGKTTLARILARESGRRFVAISAVTSGVADSIASACGPRPVRMIVSTSRVSGWIT